MSEPQRVVTVVRPRSNGCLWGCLGVALLLSLPFILAGGYGAWFLRHGLRESATMRAAIEQVQHDALAQRVLGRPITVTGVEGNVFHFMLGRGARNSYSLRLQGPRGEGTLDVTSHTEGVRVRIDAMTLTGPNGQEYDLLHHAPVTPRNSETIPI
jgi:hypothetical protein